MTPEGAHNYFVVNDPRFASLGDWDFRTEFADLRMRARTIGGEKSIPSIGQSARVFAWALPVNWRIVWSVAAEPWSP